MRRALLILILLTLLSLSCQLGELLYPTAPAAASAQPVSTETATAFAPLAPGEAPLGGSATAPPTPTETATPTPPPTATPTPPPTITPTPPPPGSILKDVTYCTAEGVDLKMDLYYPARISGPLPVAVYIYGGGWITGDKEKADHGQVGKAVLAHDYLLVSLDYRLATKYRFPAMIEDVKCAIRSLRAHAAQYGLDAGRIGVWGISSGGHLAALLGTTDEIAGYDVGQYLEQSSRVQAVVDFYGPVDLRLPLTGDANELVHDAFGTNDPQAPILVLGSPVTWVSADDPPFLILHGDSDSLVPLRQSQELFERLVAAGVPAQLVVVTNGGHGFGGEDLQPSRAALVRRIVDFFDQYLKGQ
jgi:acetyl esterase/lipase